MPKFARQNFVADGYRRAHDAASVVIRARIAARYARLFENASFLAGLRIRWRLERQIRRRVDRAAPVEGLY